MQQSLDLEGLRSFVVVADCLAFGRAAEQLSVSNPTLTRRLQRLEAALGSPLLERSTRSVALTSAGRLFLPLARQVIHDLDAAVHTVREDARSRAGHLTLASLPTITAHLLPRIIRDFRVRWPKIHLRVTQCGASAVLQRLRDGTAEFGFTFHAGDESDLVFDPLLRDPYCLIMPPGHLLARHESVAWHELKPHSLITAAPDSGNMRLLADALRGIDWRSDTVTEIDHLTASLGLVEAGLGIAVVPESALPLEPSPKNILTRPLIDPPVSRMLGLFRRRNERLSPIAQHFLMAARHTARLLSDGTRHPQ